MRKCVLEGGFDILQHHVEGGKGDVEIDFPSTP